MDDVRHLEGTIKARSFKDRITTSWLGWLTWLVALVVLLLVVRSVPLAEVLSIIQGLGLDEIGILVVMNLLVLLVLNSRWWLILRAQGHPIPLITLVGYRLAAFGVSYFTPGPHLGGEPIQIELVVRKHQIPRPSAVAALALDRSFELLVNFLILATGIFILLRQPINGIIASGETAILGAIPLVLPIAFIGSAWAGWYPVTQFLSMAERLPWWPVQGRAFNIYARFARLLRASETQLTQLCRRSPRTLLLALLVSLLGGSLLIAEYWLMVSFLGFRLTAVELMVMLTAARIAIMLPLPGDIGTLEASQVLALNLLGMESAVGLSAALLIRTRDVLLGGLGLWWGSRQWRRNGERP